MSNLHATESNSDTRTLTEAQMSMHPSFPLRSWLLVSLACLFWGSSLRAAEPTLSPWPENPWYWQYRGEPIVLLGGSDDDNLFQWPESELIPHLDRLHYAGGNVVRNTMSDRKDRGWELYPFFQRDDDKYDLTQWNADYWDRFERFLQETAKRNIIVQIEVWDRFDYTDNGGSDRWQIHPYNPKNNVNYSYEDSGFAERYPDHPGRNKQPFFFTTPQQRNNRLVLRYQQAFVDKLLDHALSYDHILYCIDNETKADPEWGEYWAQFIKERAQDAGKQVMVTEMWDDWDLKASRHRQTFDHPELYDYVDVSQNNHNRGQEHWDNFLFVRQLLSDHPRPMNTTKTYGADGNKFGHSDQDAIERFWRHLLAGGASVRFHRPPSGLGLNDKAVASLRAARQVEREVPFWTVTAANNLLAERAANEAYLAAAEQRDAMVLFFPASDEQRSVRLAGSEPSARYNIRWICIDDAREGPQRTQTKIDAVAPPEAGNWVAVLRRSADAAQQPGLTGSEAAIAKALELDLEDYSGEGRIVAGPDASATVLSNDHRAFAIFHAEGGSDESVKASTVRASGLPLTPGVDWQLRLWDPATEKDLQTRQITVHPGGEVQFLVPSFDRSLVAILEPKSVGIAGDAADVRSGPAEPSVHFKKIVLTHEYLSDGIDAGDIDRDGHMDVVSGPYWYAGPDFRERTAFYAPERLIPERSPSNSMFSFVHDFSGDGWPDILVLGRVHLHEAYWYENPGSEGTGLWKRHLAFERVRGESPQLVDLDGDGNPQVICHWDGSWGWIEPHPQQPRRPWRFVPISRPADWPQFYHGEGVGDVDGDGRADLVIHDGWFTRDPQHAPLWRFVKHRFAETKGGAQMFVDDLDRDGDNDVLTALDAHGYGISWFEQQGGNGEPRFREHKIVGRREQIEQFGVAFSQPHALAYADIDGDGLRDLVAGKRVWAHGPTGDVEPSAPPVVYWFQRQNGYDRAVSFTPHLVDDASGVGTQIQAVDVNADGRTDILTASKLGSFVFLNLGQ